MGAKFKHAAKCSFSAYMDGDFIHMDEDFIDIDTREVIIMMEALQEIAFISTHENDASKCKEIADSVMRVIYNKKTY